MGRYTCMVPGCRSKAGKDKLFHFTVSPKCALWLKAINSPFLNSIPRHLLYRHKICYKHFTSCSFASPEMNSLNRNAIPSLNLPPRPTESHSRPLNIGNITNTSETIDLDYEPCIKSARFSDSLLEKTPFKLPYSESRAETTPSSSVDKGPNTNDIHSGEIVIILNDHLAQEKFAEDVEVRHTDTQTFQILLDKIENNDAIIPPQKKTFSKHITLSSISFPQLNSLNGKAVPSLEPPSMPSKSRLDSEGSVTSGGSNICNLTNSTESIDLDDVPCIESVTFSDELLKKKPFTLPYSECRADTTEFNLDNSKPGTNRISDGLLFCCLDVQPKRNDTPHSEENVTVQKVGKVDDLQLPIQPMQDKQFRDHFRMCRQTFQILLDKIGNIYKNCDQTAIPLNQKLLFSIWVLSKQECFLAATDRFQFSIRTGHSIFYKMMDLICELMPEYIRWPQDHNRAIDGFRIRSGGIPGIVGAMDCCHIPIRQPEENSHDYKNRKQFHSIILQGICDDQALFIDVNIGQPGSMQDAHVFRLSPIYKKIMDAEEPLLSSEEHIIGDSAYPLYMNLLKRYQVNGHLSHSKGVFNKKLSAARSIIDRAFGLLKEKFRRLKYLNVAEPKTAVRIVGASCVLYNFILLQKNSLDDWNIENVCIEEENDINVKRVEDV